MTKAEAIRNTEYTEDELINLALCFAMQDMRKFRDAEGNSATDWFHYEDLRQAFSAIYDDRMMKKD